MSIMSQYEADQIQAPPYTKLEELDKYLQRGEQLLSVTLNDVPISLLGDIGAFLAKVEKNRDVVVSREYGNISVTLPVTAEQLKDRLETANEQLANDRLKYITALEFGGPSSDEWQIKDAIRRFGKRAGLAETLPRDPA